MDKLIAGQITRIILAALAGIAVKWGIEVKDTSWVEALSVSVAGVLIAVGALLWTRIRARVLLMTTPPIVTPPLIDLGATGGLDAANKPSIILLALLLLLLAGGCMGGHDFQMQAPLALAQIATQLDVGIGEYHAAENTQFNAAEAQARDRLQTALAEYVIKVAKAGGTATVDEAKAAIAPAFAAYDKDMEGITGDRRSESDRWRIMLELTEFARRVARQIAEIETERYATYDELRALAKQAVSQAMTTAAKPAAVNGGAK